MRYLSVLIPALIGFLVFSAAARSRQAPAKHQKSETAKTVRIIEMQPIDVQTRTTGYGSTVPANSWRAVSRISGKVVEVHKELKAGAVLPKDTVLMRLDASSYELTVKRLKATRAGIDAEIDQLDLQKANDEASLKIEERTLALKEKNFKREQTLFKQKAVSQSSVENLEQAYLAQKSKVQSLRNTINLIPAKRAVLEAKKSQTGAEIEQALLDTSYAVIKAPFLCRITSRSAQLADFVQVGQEVITADGLQTSEVHVKVPGGRLSPLINRRERELKPDLLTKMRSMPMSERMKTMGFHRAIVRLSSVGRSIYWDARIDRVTGEVDAASHTFTVVVAVDRPLEKAVPGRKPPLFRGSFCEVLLLGVKDMERLVIPVSAIEDGQVLIAAKDNRLLRRKVKIAYQVDDMAIIEEGLNKGDRLVVSDISGATPGTLLAPQRDEELEARLEKQARGVVDVQ